MKNYRKSRCWISDIRPHTHGSEPFNDAIAPIYKLELLVNQFGVSYSYDFASYKFELIISFLVNFWRCPNHVVLAALNHRHNEQILPLPY